MPLSHSVQLKLDRAHEHMEAIRAIVDPYRKPDCYRFFTEPEDNPDTRNAYVRYVIRVYKPLPSDLLSQLLGDCLSNFRAVLDHLVWELSELHSGPTPPKPHLVKFPSRSASRGLHAVSPTAAAEVAWLHANCAALDAGDLSPFRMLCELNNVDKHSTINVVLHHARSIDITTDPVIIGSQVELVHRGEAALEDGTVIARVIIPRPVWSREQVNVNARTEHAVVIAKTARTPRAHLGRTLIGIDEAVKKATERLGKLLP